MIEGLWRRATARVEVDPGRLDETADLEIDDHSNIDGVGINLGAVWRF